MDGASSISLEDCRDANWRLSNIYKITDKEGKAVQFRPNPAQLQFLSDVHNLNIILKARQLGFTTLCCLIYLDACIFSPNTRAGVIAHRLADAKVIFRDKIKFPYDQFVQDYPTIAAEVHTRQDSADTLTLKNNSSIRVSTSMRSGTLQYLHISEFGKICSQFPEKAREIVTGALNTIENGQFAVIESTAEGQEGKFYEMVQQARARHSEDLTPMDWKFHFYPWFEDKNYVLKIGLPPIPDEDNEYFDKLEHNLGIVVSREQRAWYIKKAETQGGDMRREYPSTPDEAFEQALEGAYWAKELLIAEKQRRIGGFPYVPNHPVNTFWDLGRNDDNVIWLHQFVEGYHRFVGYYENSGEFIGHYISWVREWARDRNAVFGDHYLPHDGDRQYVWLPEGTMKVMSDLGFHPQIVKRPQVLVEAIGVARGKFGQCVWDKTSCDRGIQRLKQYRKEWDDVRGVWRDRARHDEASHAASAFMTFTSSNYTPPAAVKPRERYRPSSSDGESWMAA